MKTYEEYLNDPDIADEPMALREIHAIRLKIQDETRDMTREELEAYHREKRKRIDADCARLGIKLNYVTLPTGRIRAPEKALP